MVALRGEVDTKTRQKDDWDWAPASRLQECVWRVIVQHRCRSQRVVAQDSVLRLLGDYVHSRGPRRLGSSCDLSEPARLCIRAAVEARNIVGCRLIRDGRPDVHTCRSTG